MGVGAFGASKRKGMLFFVVIKVLIVFAVALSFSVGLDQGYRQRFSTWSFACLRFEDDTLSDSLENDLQY